MQGQMDLFNPPDMHIVNVCGELREAPCITNGVRTVLHGKCLKIISNHQKDGGYMDGVRKPSKEVRQLPIA